MGRMIDYGRARSRDKMTRSGVEAAALSEPLTKPLGKRSKTIFGAPGKTAGSNLRKLGNDALAAHQQRQRNLKLAAQIGGRDTSAEVVEHIPVERVYVSPERQRDLQERPGVSQRIVRRHHETGEIIAIGRMVRELVEGRYVTRWEDEARS
jgi:hypothetical protein